MSDQGPTADPPGQTWALAAIRASAQVTLPEQGDPGDALLSERILDAEDYVALITGRQPLSSTPQELVRTLRAAVLLRVEQVTLTRTRRTVSQNVNASGVTSFSVPGFSESRADGASRSARGVTVNPWPELSDLLLMLMTPEKLSEYRLAQGLPDPDGAGFLDFASIRLDPGPLEPYYDSDCEGM